MGGENAVGAAFHYLLPPRDLPGVSAADGNRAARGSNTPAVAAQAVPAI
jgi:hypothetical protein